MRCATSTWIFTTGNTSRSWDPPAPGRALSLIWSEHSIVPPRERSWSEGFRLRRSTAASWRIFADGILWIKDGRVERIQNRDEINIEAGEIDFAHGGTPAEEGT